MPATRGTTDSCACPHCRRPNNFSDETEFLEKGNSFKCDHCDRIFYCVEVKRVTLLLLSTAEPR